MGILDEIAYILNRQYYAWKSFIAYRLSALLWFFNNSFTAVASYVSITVIYAISSGINGWSYYQLLMLSSTVNMITGLLYYFLNPNLSHELLAGQLDPALSRPFNKLSILISDNIGVWSFGSVLSNLLIAVYALAHLHLAISFIISYIILLILGTAGFGFFMLIMLFIAYKFIKSEEFVWRMIDFANTAGDYPINIYGNLIGIAIFSLLIPVGLASYFPALALFGRLSLNYFILIILVNIAIILFSYKIFNLLLRSYNSGGG
ncbi:MAG: ABC-2 family transporter protein [Candidatus Marsarchaeota archaeon]|nr:ABC-2 family transporter protein [Candidatus Marsarchaeota archaeon]MCL5106445.1 ABC-2 family transporter protein [Candidatus Marsarchaeota archaeon]